MGDISKDINSTFANQKVKAMLNIIYTSNWITSCQNEFFKDFVVECNYISKVIKVYEPSAYNVRKKCRGCTALSVEFENNKPYINAEVQVGGNVVTTKLLVDSGSSDGLWLFHNSSEDLNKPTKSFRDYLGLGLTGDIFGDRSKVKHLKLDKFKLKNVTAAYPDTLALSAQAITNDRNGSLGSEVLRRFKVVIDYPRERILLKKNKDGSAYYYWKSYQNLEEGILRFFGFFNDIKA